MFELLTSIGQAVLITAGFIGLCTLAEWISPRGKMRWLARWPGILFGLLAPVSALAISAPLRALWSSMGIPPLIHLPADSPALSVVLMLLIGDFFGYWEYRFEHRYLWPIHAVHHSVEELSAATSYSHPLQYISIFFFSVPVSLIDFGRHWVLGVALVIVAFLQLLIHSPIRIGFGPLRYVFVDPAYHRIHHSREEQHFDQNFAILFSFWDRLFGTCFMPRPQEWPATGIREAASPRSLAELLIFPVRLWRAARQIEERPVAGRQSA